MAPEFMRSYGTRIDYGRRLRVGSRVITPLLILGPLRAHNVAPYVRKSRIDTRENSRSLCGLL